MSDNDNDEKLQTVRKSRALPLKWTRVVSLQTMTASKVTIHAIEEDIGQVNE